MKWAYFTPNVRLHLLVATLTATWLVLFLIFIAPFDTADLSFKIRWMLLPPYGLINIACYMALIPLQNGYFRKNKQWTLAAEVVFLLLFCLLSLAATFAYYKTDWINGTYSFGDFVGTVYAPIVLILMPVLIGLRWFITKTKGARKTQFRAETAGQRDEWKTKLESCIKEGIFLNPKITLQQTADTLGTNTSNLSKLINLDYGLNFNDFVNKIRVEAVMDKIAEGEHQRLTLTAIAESCGFSSKSTFNRAFKKVTGMSPSAYVRTMHDPTQ